MTFSFDAAERIIYIGFARTGGVIATRAEIDAFVAAIAVRCSALPDRAHFFFDLSHLSVAPEVTGAFSEAKATLCDRHAASVWHYGGELAERVMTRDESGRKGLRSNLYRTREEALAAFRLSRPLVS
jgi:hypothetical protein